MQMFGTKNYSGFRTRLPCTKNQPSRQKTVGCGQVKKKPAKNPKFGMVKNKKMMILKKIAPWGIGPEGGKEKKIGKIYTLERLCSSICD